MRFEDILINESNVISNKPQVKRFYKCVCVCACANLETSKVSNGLEGNTILAAMNSCNLTRSTHTVRMLNNMQDVLSDCI